jgi:hypothetical protein
VGGPADGAVITGKRMRQGGVVLVDVGNGVHVHDAAEGDRLADVRLSTAAISSARSRIRAETRCKMRRRSLGGVSCQGGNAARAAAMAVSTSSAVTD